MDTNLTLNKLINSNKLIKNIHESVDLKHDAVFKQLPNRKEIKRHLAYSYVTFIAISDDEIYMLYPKMCDGRLSKEKKVYTLIKYDLSGNTLDVIREYSLNKILVAIPNVKYYVQTGSSIRERDDDYIDKLNDVYFDFRSICYEKLPNVEKLLKNKIYNLKLKLVTKSGDQFRSLCDKIIELENYTVNMSKFAEAYRIKDFLINMGYQSYWTDFGFYSNMGEGIKQIMTSHNLTIDMLSRKYIMWAYRKYILAP